MSTIGKDIEHLIQGRFGPRSQKRAAELLGLSQAYLSDICNGRRGISADVAVRLSRVFGADVGEELFRKQAEDALADARKAARARKREG